MNFKTIGIGGTTIAAVMMSMTMASSPAQAAAFTNGSFEVGTTPNSSPGFTTLNNGSTSITGWNVIGNSIDYIGGYWKASAGSRSIDLAGNASGGIEQTFDTIKGLTYKVAFDLAGNPDDDNLRKYLTVKLPGFVSTFSFRDGGASRSNMGWSNFGFDFVANSTSTTIQFLNDGDPKSPYGAALDNVSVAAVAVPTPALLPGLLALGAGMLRKRKADAIAAVDAEA